MAGSFKTFKNKEEEVMWKAFKGECGKEYAGNPFFMEEFMEIEAERIAMKEDLGRDL